MMLSAVVVPRFSTGDRSRRGQRTQPAWPRLFGPLLLLLQPPDPDSVHNRKTMFVFFCRVGATFIRVLRLDSSSPPSFNCFPSEGLLWWTTFWLLVGMNVARPEDPTKLEAASSCSEKVRPESKHPRSLSRSPAAPPHVEEHF